MSGTLPDGGRGKPVSVFKGSPNGLPSFVKGKTCGTINEMAAQTAGQNNGSANLPGVLIKLHFDIAYRVREASLRMTQRSELRRNTHRLKPHGCGSDSQNRCEKVIERMCAPRMAFRATRIGGLWSGLESVALEIEPESESILHLCRQRGPFTRPCLIP